LKASVIPHEPFSAGIMSEFTAGGQVVRDHPGSAESIAAGAPMLARAETRYISKICNENQ
jgi:hypothetical protein